MMWKEDVVAFCLEKVRRRIIISGRITAVPTEIRNRNSWIQDRSVSQLAAFDDPGSRVRMIGQNNIRNIFARRADVNIEKSLSD
jgi:hypothetical protein